MNGVSRLTYPFRSVSVPISESDVWLVKGYGITGNVERAASFTQRVFEARDDYGLALCELWKEMAGQQQGQDSLQSEWESLQDSPVCQVE